MTTTVQRFPTSPSDVTGVFGEQFAPWAIVRRSPRPGEWGPAELVRTDQLQISVAAPALHYGLNCFEGMKAYRNSGGALHLFRPADHAARFQRSAQRLCMEAPSVALFEEDCATVVDANAAFTPAFGAGALYLRPLLLGSETYLGVRPSNEHLFIVLVSPVNRIVSSPIDVLVSTRVTRAPKGGLGACKTGANYAGGMHDSLAAKAKGFGHVLFLDAETTSNIVEGLSSNILFVLNDRIVTPPLDDTILPGITRDTCLQLLRGAGHIVEERTVPVTEVQQWAAEGRLREAILVGTAAVVTPVRSIHFTDGMLTVPVGDVCPWLLQAYEDLAWRSSVDNNFRYAVSASTAHEAPVRPHDHGSALRWAHAWANAWNRKDFDAIAARFADDCHYHSPMAQRARGSADLRGRTTLRAYWEEVSGGYSSIDFQVQTVVFDGAQLAIYYSARINGGDAYQSAELFRLNPAGLVDHAIATAGAKIA